MPDKPYLYLKSSTEQGILVLTITEPRIQGDQVAEALRKEMLSALEESGATMVVVDCQHTQYLSSTAFRPFLALRRKLLEMGGRIVLCGLTGVVRDVFLTTRMVSSSGSVTAPFEMEADVPSALARLAGSPQPR